MAKKIYRSARGQAIDLQAVLGKNETVPALGNMNVNARGDEILSDGTIVKTREQVMREYHTMVPKEGAIPESAAHGIAMEDPYDESWIAKPKEELIKEDPITMEEKIEEPKPTAGLAASVAASKTVTSSVKSTTSTKETTGVTRL